ncbi:hypothetical protein L1987_15965 [Smallanthus sonchifolius]|uniref:Uncharacterized protein n=1 Tax=Smallanthus sonchifolius TaxID=185202 RepID=A0ACB9J816_9ASTR|nr:hypothetical protein L1987_15965 [Smallanthus sonchifolius]
MKGGKSSGAQKKAKLAVKKTATKGKAAKDPNKPKRPASAFFVFMEEFRKQFKEENPDNKSVAAVGKAGGVKWKAMSVSEKAPYVAKADKRKAEYEKTMVAYNKKQASGRNDGDDDSDKSKSEVNNEEEDSDDDGDEAEDDEAGREEIWVGTSGNTPLAWRKMMIELGNQKKGKEAMLAFASSKLAPFGTFFFLRSLLADDSSCFVTLFNLPCRSVEQGHPPFKNLLTRFLARGTL